MNSRDYFVLGCKLLGVYLVFTSFPYVCGLVATTFFRPADYNGISSRIMATTLYFQSLVIFGQIGLGIYFLRGGKLVYDLAYPSSAEIYAVNMKNTLQLGLKLLGMYFIIKGVPDILSHMSNFLASTRSPGWFGMLNDRMFITVVLLPNFAGIALGLYLLRTDNIFARIAINGKFSSERESE